FGYGSPVLPIGEVMLPTFLWNLLRCPQHRDGTLAILRDGSNPMAMRCLTCGETYSIADGIPDLLDLAALRDDFVNAECRQWDRQARNYTSQRLPDLVYQATAEATVKALAAAPGDWILDAGCGTGLHLQQYWRPGMRVVALDLSMESLRQLR